MRKHTRRKPAGHLPHYTLVHEMMASPTEPVAEHLLAAHLGKVRGARLALQTDASPSPTDWGTLSDAVNMLASLQELGYINDDSGEIIKAKDAMGQAGARHLEGGVLRLTGPGITTLHLLLDDYSEVVRALSARQFIKAVRHTEKRVLEIIRGKAHRGDKVVAL